MISPTILTAAAAALMAAMAVPAANAASLAPPFGECRTGYWSGTRNLDDNAGFLKGTCLVNWKQSFNQQVRMNVGSHIGVRDTADARGSSARLREAYLETDVGPLRFRIGRQIIAWGRADRINPTDNLSPRDFTALVPEDEEQRIGLDAVLVNYRLMDNLELVTAIVPRTTPHLTPTASLPRNRVTATTPDDGEWALKLEKSGGAWDGSVSYYHGYDRFSRYGARFDTPATFMFAAVHEKMRTAGADFSSTVQGWGVRAEFGASKFSAACPGCTSDSRTVRRMVIGVDRDIGESFNINTQVFRIHRARQASTSGMPGQLHAIELALNRLNSEFSAQEYGLSMRLSGRYLNDRLKLELGGILDISSQSGLIRPRATYSISDSVKLTAGADAFYGEEQSFFGTRARNRLGFIELAYVF